jgi:hypothetical protein
MQKSRVSGVCARERALQMAAHNDLLRDRWNSERWVFVGRFRRCWDYGVRKTRWKVSLTFLGVAARYCVDEEGRMT